jgi:ubiquinone/menaquinone biosynthesis C-methylase UbiE
VEFRKCEIEALPLGSHTVDVVISNNVIFSSPNKSAVFEEAFRVLKSGGRLVIADHATEGDISHRLRANIGVYVMGHTVSFDDCVIDKQDYVERLRRVGFTDITVQDFQSYGIEALGMLDEKSREALSQGVDWSTIPADARYCNVDIVAYKPN